MGKNNNKKARAAKSKASVEQHQEPQKFLTPNDLIEEAMKKDFVGLLKMKRFSNGLLDISIVKQDARTPIMKRNAEQSLLLRLPAELRNKIFRMVVGDQHIHISVLQLPTKPTEPVELPAFTLTPELTYSRRCLPDRLRHDLRYDKSQREYQPRINNAYPLEWRAYYDSQAVTENQKTKYLSMMVPEKRIVYSSASRMTIFAMTCRQIHSEVGLLPYSANEFSFCSPYALNAWLEKRLLPQRRAIKVLWLDNEWADYGSAPVTLNELCLTGATLKVSRLTWTAVSRAYWEANRDRALGRTPIVDLDADMDNIFDFEAWLEKTCAKSRKSGRLEVDYVQE